jgi:hypothetical protein
MNWQTLKTALPAVLIAVAIAPHPTLAQNLCLRGSE